MSNNNIPNGLSPSDADKLINEAEHNIYNNNDITGKKKPQIRRSAQLNIQKCYVCGQDFFPPASNEHLTRCFKCKAADNNDKPKDKVNKLKIFKKRAIVVGAMIVISFTMLAICGGVTFFGNIFLKFVGLQ